MRFGFVVTYADAEEFVELAQLGEAHGWDGVFTWETLWGVDAWVTLGAAARATERIRLGTMLTPVARVAPWDLASRVGTVDRLSHGRTILSAGLGAMHEGWTSFEHDEGRRVRAEKLDECLAIYDGLLRGQPFSYKGRHYSASPTTFFPPPPPIQQPRPPVWVVGAYVEGRSTQPSLDRAARWDGLLPQLLVGEEHREIDRLDALATVLDAVRDRRHVLGRDDEPYDVVIEADSTGEFIRLDPDDPAKWEEAGATWWVESWWTLEPGLEGIEELRRRVALGPPR
jgi:alkanesulfonate monooxygenase SsuD/methylene tetrahydromethanopterin reductase-like flavin-dependent oxidoreductase (luciferase family)